MNRKRIRRACRSLARKGLAEFHRGLWRESGEPGGSGYGATRAGRVFADESLQ
jgi:monoamine oxidase